MNIKVKKKIGLRLKLKEREKIKVFTNFKKKYLTFSKKHDMLSAASLRKPFFS